MKKKLIKKFTVEIDESLLGIGVKASVGINRDPKLKEAIHKKFMETSEVEERKRKEDAEAKKKKKGISQKELDADVDVNLTQTKTITFLIIKETAVN